MDAEDYRPLVTALFPPAGARNALGRGVAVEQELVCADACTGRTVDLERVAGRLDLRGLWLARTRGLPGLPADPLATVPTAEGVTWRDLDLSGSTFRIQSAWSMMHGRVSRR